MTIYQDYNYLASWAKEFKEGLSPETIKLINLANSELYFGPLNEDMCESEEDWKLYQSFTSACKRIREGLKDVPRKLYYDIMHPCNWSILPLEDIGDNCDCVDRKCLITEIVGKELAEFVI